MLTSLEDLKIAGSFIRQLTLHPGKKLEIRLLHGPISKKQGDVVEELDLEFHGLTICSLELKAAPWIEIMSLEVEPKSNSSGHDETLRDVSDESESTKDGSSELQQFHLVCEEGKIEIVAERFISTIVNEIPFVDRIRRPAGFDDPKVSLDESSQIECGFCGRKQFEVSKIITGSEANICGDCIRICIDLIN